MKTVQLKEISGYLPYNLKCKIQKGIIASLGGITVVNNYWEFVAVFEGYGEYGSATFKPILRPLSDLVKPCLEDGNIPIVKLANICFEKAGYKAKMQEDGRVFVYNNHPTNPAPLCSFSFDKSHHSFSVMDLFYDGKYREHRDVFCANQLQLFQKLYEWHFDVHGLVEKNIAIDINNI